MSYLVVLPSIDAEYRDACLAGLAPEVLKHVIVVDNRFTNRGVATSWNRGARHVLQHGIDWLVILSESTRFGPRGGRDFVAALK